MHKFIMHIHICTSFLLLGLESGLMTKREREREKDIDINRQIYSCTYSI